MLNDCPAQLQIIRFNGQKYDLHVSYIQGKSMHAENTLSRAAMTEKAEEIEPELESGNNGDKVCTDQIKKRQHQTQRCKYKLQNVRLTRNNKTV